MITSTKNKKEEKIITNLKKRIEELSTQIDSLSQDDYSKNFFQEKIGSLKEAIDYIKQTIIHIIEECLENMTEKELRNCQLTKDCYEFNKNLFKQSMDNAKELGSSALKDFRNQDTYVDLHLTNKQKERIVDFLTLGRYYKSKDLEYIDASILFLEEEEIRKHFTSKMKNKNLIQEIERAVDFYHLYKNNSEEFDKKKFEQFLKDCTPSFYEYLCKDFQKELETLIARELEELKLPKGYLNIIEKLKIEGFYKIIERLENYVQLNEYLKTKEESIKEETTKNQQKIEREEQQFNESLKDVEILKKELLDYCYKKFEIKKNACSLTKEEERLLLELLQNQRYDKDFFTNIENFFQYYYQSTLEEEQLNQYDRNFKMWQETFKMKASETGHKAERELARYHRYEQISLLEQEKEGLEIKKVVLEEELRKYGPKFFLIFSKKRKEKYKEIQNQIKETERLLEKNEHELAKKKKYFNQDQHKPYTEKNFLREKNENMQQIMQFLTLTNEIVIPMPNSKTEIENSYAKAFESIENDFASISIPKESVLLDFMRRVSDKYIAWSSMAREELVKKRKKTESYEHPFIDLLCQTYGCERNRKLNFREIENIKEILDLLQLFKSFIEENHLNSLTMKDLERLNKIYNTEIELPNLSNLSIAEKDERELSKKRKKPRVI